MAVAAVVAVTGLLLVFANLSRVAEAGLRRLLGPELVVGRVEMVEVVEAYAAKTFLNGGPRAPLATEGSKGVKWERNVWHKIRLERNAGDGTIKVFFDDMAKPSLQATVLINISSPGLNSDSVARVVDVGFVAYGDWTRIRSNQFLEGLLRSVQILRMGQ